MTESTPASRHLDALIDAARAQRLRPISARAEAAEFNAIESSVRTTIASQRRRMTIVHAAGVVLALAAGFAVIFGAPRDSGRDGGGTEAAAETRVASTALTPVDPGAHDGASAHADVATPRRAEDPVDLPAHALPTAATPSDQALPDPTAVVVAAVDTWQTLSPQVDLKAVWPVVGGLSTIVAAYVFGGDTLVIETHVSARAGTAAGADAEGVDEPERLARAAEAHMLAGRDHKARELLARIVTKYAKSRQARTALLDLARLERRLGAAARAACAYGTFLSKYPGDAMANEASKRLGELPVTACRGLRPTASP